MTIAAGFVCVDGIVLGADTEYTSVGSKYDGEKLFGISKGDWAMLVAGAGTMDLVKMVVDAFRHDLDEVDGLASLRKKIIDIAGHFHAQHILPMQGTNEPRQLLLLVAIQIRNGENLLLKINGDVVTPVHGNEFIGYGDDIARAASSWLLFPAMTVSVAIPMAIQVLNWVKKHAAYCGKNTLVAALRKQSKFEYFPDIVDVETEGRDFFWGMNIYLREVLIGCVCQQMEDDEFEDRLRRLSEFMRSKRLENVSRQQSLSDSSSSDPNTKP